MKGQTDRQVSRQTTILKENCTENIESKENSPESNYNETTIQGKINPHLGFILSQHYL